MVANAARTPRSGRGLAAQYPRSPIAVSTISATSSPSASVGYPAGPVPSTASGFSRHWHQPQPPGSYATTWAMYIARPTSATRAAIAGRIRPRIRPVGNSSATTTIAGTANCPSAPTGTQAADRCARPTDRGGAATAKEPADQRDRPGSAAPEEGNGRRRRGKQHSRQGRPHEHQKVHERRRIGVHGCRRHVRGQARGSQCHGRSGGQARVLDMHGLIMTPPTYRRHGGTPDARVGTFLMARSGEAV